MVASILLLVCYASLSDDNHRACNTILPTVNQAAQQLVDDVGIPGLSVAVTYAGELVHLRGYGDLNVDRRTIVKPDSIFRISSVTKAMSSVAALILVEQGKLGLHDPIANYVPEIADMQVLNDVVDGRPQFKSQNSPITVFHLLTHTAGLPWNPPYRGSVDSRLKYIERRYSAANVRAAKNTLAEAVTRLSRLPLEYQPGESYKYSMATEVLHRVIEVSSGQSIDEFMSANIFAPLLMASTGFRVAPTDRHKFGPVYLLADDGTKTEYKTSLNSVYTAPAGQNRYLAEVVSTVRDLSIFARMLENNGTLNGTRILGPELVRLMTSNQLSRQQLAVLVDPLSRGRGFGVWVANDDVFPDALISPGSYGKGGGTNSFFWVDKEKHITVSILANFRPYKAHGIDRAIAEAVSADYDRLVRVKTATQCVVHANAR